jgi:hypothetical protein
MLRRHGTKALPGVFFTEEWRAGDGSRPRCGITEPRRSEPRVRFDAAVNERLADRPHRRCSVDCGAPQTSLKNRASLRGIIFEASACFLDRVGFCSIDGLVKTEILRSTPNHWVRRTSAEQSKIRIRRPRFRAAINGGKAARDRKSRLRWIASSPSRSPTRGSGSRARCCRQSAHMRSSRQRCACGFHVYRCPVEVCCRSAQVRPSCWPLSSDRIRLTRFAPRCPRTRQVLQRR